MFNVLLGCLHALSFFFFSSHAIHKNHDYYAHQPTPPIIISEQPTYAPSPTISGSISPTPTISITPTMTPTDTPTPTLSLTITPTETPTPTLTPTPTSSISPEPSETPIPTSTPTPTMTPTPTVSLTTTPTLIPTPTSSISPLPTETPIPTSTPTPTMTPTPTVSITPTASPTPIMTLTPTPDASATPTVDPSDPPDPSATPTATITPTPTPTQVGNDISYPQCGQTLPTGQGYGIVGVNGGLATTTNPCLSTELLWAGQSLGTANQAKVQLYVNTGNPGGLGTPSWPQNNTDPAGNVSPNPVGTCDGSVSDACAWQYGWNRAVDDVQNNFIPAAQAAGVDSTPSDYPWWLDVETTNSWESGSTDALTQNRLDLEAMVSYLQSRGITVGIYSTNFQWGTIVGDVPSSSNLNGLKNWRPGASNLTDAQSNCGLTALTSGGSVSMTQFTTNNFDYDYSCL
jgi:hypothetical protein